MGFADDEPQVARELSGLIRSTDDVAMVGEASGPDAVIELLSEDPDVVVVDLAGHPERLRVTRAIVERDPTVGVVVVADPGGAEVASETLRAGARGLVARTASRDQLLDAVRRVAGGNVVIDAATWEASTSPGEPAPAMIHLTRREVEVLRLLARGYTNKQIARKLGLAGETVKTHLDRIFRRLGVSNRTDAVAKAIRAGFVE